MTNSRVNHRKPLGLKVLIADDHAMMREGIALMVHAEWPDAQCHFANDYQSVVGTLDQLIASSPSYHPYSVVVLDLRMPGMRGAESVAEITKRCAANPVVVCTALDDPSLLQRLHATGVWAVVSKASESEDFLNVLRQAVSSAQSPAYLRGDFEATQPMGFHALSGSADFALSIPGALAIGSASLTQRQRDILKLLHLGKPNKVIAGQMGIGLGTVKTHLHMLYATMGVSSRSEAVSLSQGWML